MILLKFLSSFIAFANDFLHSGLGLAPPNATSQSYSDGSGRETEPHPNFLYELTRSGTFDHNSMTFRLPRYTGDIGKLILGEPAPVVHHRIPLTADRPRALEGSWVISLRHMSFIGNIPPLNLSVDFFAAVTLPPDFVLTLLADLTDFIYDYLGAKASEEIDGGVIDCEALPALPDLTLTLGSEPVVLAWEDYSTVWVSGKDRVCAVTIVGQNHDNHSVILGHKLLEKFDVVFDMDRAEIGCQFSHIWHPRTYCT